MATKYTRQKDGRFQAKVWTGTYTKTGAKKYISIYSTKSSKDLERKVNLFKQELDAGMSAISTDMTFYDYALSWLNTYKKVRERGTQIMYENIINTHLFTLSCVHLSDIRRTHLQLVINNNIEKARTCQQIYVTFKQIIKSAISDKLLPVTALDNICGNIELPKYVAKEKRGLTDIEKDALKKADFSPREKAFVYIAYGCGLRRGEILALTIFDISLERNELTVNKALAFDGNNPYIKGTKSVNGNRIVPIPPFLNEFISEYIKTLPGTNLFYSANNEYMTASAYNKMWSNIVSKMNVAAGGSNKIKIINGLTAHIFRHNYCANLCYQMPNISIKRIAQLLGDSEKMVLEVYNHVLEQKENVQEVVKNAINF